MNEDERDHGRERGHHDRSATRAADTWGDEPMDEETALELRDKLREKGYEVRLTVEALHPDSVVVKTVDSQHNADRTLVNIRLDDANGGEQE